MATGIEQIVRSARDAIAPSLREGEPLTFWLGAGASLSSGGPTTSAVCDVIDVRAGGRGDSARGDITRAFSECTTVERMRQIQPLFTDFTPYLGYRLLAALGRTRPIRVVNLNWDRGVEQACELLGVPCKTFDIDDLGGHPEYTEWSSATEPGVVVVHLHGLLDAEGDDIPRDVRYAAEDTLRLQSDQIDLVSEYFLAHTTIVIGASLEGDTDVTDLLRTLHDAADRPKPVFLFGRYANEPESRAREWLRSRQSNRNAVFDPAVDFDRVMLHLAEGLAGFHFESLSGEFGGLTIPNPTRLIMPKARNLRNLLDQPVITLVGKPEIGKTTTALLLGHIATLCAEGQYATSPLRVVSTTADSISALGEAVTAPLVIDDPFGGIEDDFRDAVILRESMANPPAVTGWTPIVVTVRRGVQTIVLDGAPAPEDGVLNNDELFNSHELKLLTKPTDGEVIAGIEAGSITTPWQVYRAQEGLPSTDDAKQDTLVVFQQQPPVALLAALTRLQAFSDDPRPVPELVGLVSTQGLDSADAERDAKWLLNTFTLDSKPYARLDASVAEAVDDLLGDPDTETSQHIAALADITPWVAEARAVQRVFRAGRAGVVAATADLTEQQLTEWLPSLFDAYPTASDLVSDEHVAALDAWGSCELALNLLVRWTNGNNTSNRLLNGLLQNRPVNGVYALVEAACYLGTRTPPQPRAKIVAALWDLLENNNIGEALRCYDALLWQPDAITTLGIDDQWIRDLYAKASLGQAQGALLAIHAYHPHSEELLSRLDVGDRLNRVVIMTEDEVRGAVAVIRWHFVHQARNTAIMLRHRMVDLTALGTAPTSTAEDEASGRASHFLEGMLAHDIGAGWVAVAGLNLMSNGPAGNYTGAVNRALEAAHRDDPGLIAALLGYTIPADCLGVARRRFASVRDAAMDALTTGIDTDNGDSADFGWNSTWLVKAPRFKMIRDAFAQLTRLQVRWRGLESVNFILPGQTNEVLTALHQHRATALDRFPAGIVDDILAEADTGDFRAFNDAARTPRRTPARNTAATAVDLFNIIADVRTTELVATEQQAAEEASLQLDLGLDQP